MGPAKVQPLHVARYTFNQLTHTREVTDYVIATGEAHNVRDFCEEAFGLVDFDWNENVRRNVAMKTSAISTLTDAVAP